MSPYPSPTTYPSTDLYPGYADVGPRPRVIVRDRPSLRLMVDVEAPDGEHARWGDDEPDPANVPSSLGFSSTMPGGFEQLSVTLPRKPAREYPDLTEFSKITAYGVGGEIAWQGRLESAPRAFGDQISIMAGAVGYQAALSDDQTARCIYVDCDLSRWGEPSTEWKITENAVAVYGNASVSPSDDGAPSLFHTLPDTIAGLYPLCESWYDASGAGSVAYVYAQAGTVSMPTGWQMQIWGAVSGTTISSEWGFWGTAPNSGYIAFTTPERFASLRTLTTGVRTYTGMSYSAHWDNVAVYGNHGLTLRGTANPMGVYASDVIRHAVQTWAPDLAMSFAGEDTITPTSFVIPHLIFPDPTTAAEIITQASRFGLEDWAIWDGPTFWFHPRGARGKSWRARVGPSGLSETGPQVERIANGVVVAYQSVDGVTRTVGPTGSGSDVEDETLLDADPSNPATAAGLKRWPILQMGTSTPAGAIKVGSIFLAEQRALSTAGQAILVGHVEDDHGVLWPAWKVRAGDTIRFVDAADPSDRRIVKTSYDDSAKACIVDLDSPPDGLTALLARLSVVLAPLGLT